MIVEVQTDSHTTYGGTTQTVRAGGTSVSTEVAQPVTQTTTRRANEHVVRSSDATPEHTVQTKAYVADGFAFEFEVEFPNRQARDLSGGPRPGLSCPT